jgi:apolipoprotein D and lipocalin family protein
MSRKFVAAGVLMILAALVVKADKKNEPLRVVPSVDLDRYQGLWYEIARLPNRFEKKCASDVTARYERLGKNQFKVINKCRKHDGRLTIADGVARPAHDQGPNSRLKVRFTPGFLSFLPFVWGDYQIIELAPDYSYAVVGDESRKYFWVLAREPQLDHATYGKILASAASQGFDASRVVKTKHS